MAIFAVRHARNRGRRFLPTPALRVLFVAGFCLIAPGPVRAEQLAIVEDVPFEDLREQGQRLLRAADHLPAQLPGEARRSLRELMDRGAGDPGPSATKMQKLLDRYCLFQVNINPESRVKAVRGPAAAVLYLNKQAFFLVKVHNEAGITHALRVRSEAVQTPGQSRARQWLAAEIYHGAGYPRTLSGHRLEYLLLGLQAGEPGKREATLKFDAGQGTQDLGFRAEVPVLFSVLRAADK